MIRIRTHFLKIFITLCKSFNFAIVYETSQKKKKKKLLKWFQKLHLTTPWSWPPPPHDWHLPTDLSPTPKTELVNDIKPPGFRRGLNCRDLFHAPHVILRKIRGRIRLVKLCPLPVISFLVFTPYTGIIVCQQSTPLRSFPYMYRESIIGSCVTKSLFGNSRFRFD